MFSWHDRSIAPEATGPFAIVALRPSDRSRIDWIADRMRDTLVEVLGEERGRAMYTPSWLRQRVRWHLDPAACVGAGFVACRPDGEPIGHALVRVEGTLGLIATTYVDLSVRRAGVASALIAAGERWLVGRGARRLGTNTAATNQPLIQLYQRRGYAITHRAAEQDMVQLTRPV